MLDNSAINLVNIMMMKNSMNRADITQVTQHPWFEIFDPIKSQVFVRTPIDERNRNDHSIEQKILELKKFDDMTTFKFKPFDNNDANCSTNKGSKTLFPEQENEIFSKKRNSHNIDTNSLIDFQYELLNYPLYGSEDEFICDDDEFIEDNFSIDNDGIEDTLSKEKKNSFSLNFEKLELADQFISHGQFNSKMTNCPRKRSFL